MSSSIKNLLNEFKYLLFDFDGTLVDSNGVIDIMENLFHDVSSNLTLSQIEQLKIAGEKDSCKLLKEWSCTTMSVEEIQNIMQKRIDRYYKDDVLPKPYVLDFLKRQFENKKKMAIVSSSSSRVIKSVLDKYNIGHYFEFVLSANDTSLNKNQQAIYHLAAEKFKTSENKILMFDDSITALTVANQAGIVTVGVADTTNMKYRNLMKERCNEFINDFNY